MVGKYNVVFGFLFLVLTAALGPVMVFKYQDWSVAYGEKQQSMGRVQQLKADNFEENLETLTGEKIAKANTDGLLAINKLVNIETDIGLIRGGPHSHGNLESLLNIVVGITLMFIGGAKKLRQAVSWIFIVGTLLHSGMLYLERVFQIEWASTVLKTGIGPGLILLGLLAMGVLAAMYWQGVPNRSDNG